MLVRIFGDFLLNKNRGIYPSVLFPPLFKYRRCCIDAGQGAQ
jgi:hypothetical protein